MNYFFSLLLSFLFSANCLAGTTSEVSLRDKIGQMLLIGFNGKTINSKSSIVQMIDKDNIGGLFYLTTIIIQILLIKILRVRSK